MYSIAMNPQWNLLEEACDLTTFLPRIPVIKKTYLKWQIQKLLNEIFYRYIFMIKSELVLILQFSDQYPLTTNFRFGNERILHIFFPDGIQNIFNGFMWLHIKISGAQIRRQQVVHFFLRLAFQSAKGQFGIARSKKPHSPGADHIIDPHRRERSI